MKNRILMKSFLGFQITTTMVPPICTDELGSATHPLSEEQVTVSSSKDTDDYKSTRSTLKSQMWEPLINSPSEWIQVLIFFYKLPLDIDNAKLTVQLFGTP